jgi:hypothetical protein
MVITPKNSFKLKPDETYPNIVRGIKDKLLEITEVKGMTIEGSNRKTVTSKIFKRIHAYIALSKNDKMINLDDIITYLDNVSYVNKASLPIIYKALTSQDLPPIVMETHLLNKFVGEGYRSLYADEKPFFKDNYGANPFFLRKPSFSGSSVVSMDDMKMYHKMENFETGFDTLLTYIEGKGDILHVGDDYFMSRKSHEAEQFIMKNTAVVCEALIADEKKIIIDSMFSDEQTTAIKSILTSTTKITCLTGSAGTGKTRVISNIVDNAHANGKGIVCCSFTGKAASRMEQSEIDVTKILFPPKTIHSLMGTIKFSENVNIDLVIIDEASTMNSELLAEFLSVLDHHATLSKIKFIFVGDANQLPPIGGGQIFEDIITLNIYPTYRLTKIFRTADAEMLELYSDVLKAKHKIATSKHSKFFCGYNPDDVGNVILNLVNRLFERDNLWYKDNKCIILSHTNKYVDYFNYLCYQKITGKTIAFYEYTFEDHPDDIEVDWEPIPVFWVGAKIIFTKNDKIDLPENGEMIRVNNGTVGEVMGVMGEFVQIKSYDDGRTFFVERDYDTVKLAYAMTVFKSQGSEAQYIIYFHSNNIFETKRLAYTAITRARKHLKIYTPREGFKMSLDVGRFTNINSN